MTFEPEFKFDREKLEKQLRKNLTGKAHTKESLINCAVTFALDLQAAKLEIEQIRKQFNEETAGINFLRQILNRNNKSDLNELANVIEDHFKNPYFAGLLRQAHTTVKKHIAKTNSDKAHDDTNQLKQTAFDYWRKNIDPSLSGIKAGKLLATQVPLKEGTLADYVTQDFKTGKMKTPTA